MSAQTKPLRSNNSFRWMSAEAYLFDIDGTLVNSRDGVHYNAFHVALQKVYGLTTKIDSVPVHGNTDLGILRAVTLNGGISEADFLAKLPAAVDIMCEEARRNAGKMAPQVCPSVVEMLLRLQAAGKLLGVVSGNLEPIGWLKLQAAELRQFFAFGSFSGPNELRADIFRQGIGEARRQLGEGAQVCIVGDTPSDIQAARQLRVPVISVATGMFSQEELLSHGPDTCVTCCTDLLQLA